MKNVAHTKHHAVIAFSVLGLIAVLAFFAWPADEPVETTETTIIATAHYQCDGGKYVDARYYTDSVFLDLSDIRARTLLKIVSASGARYTDEDETFIFWNKGDTAFIQEGTELTFTNCRTTR